MLILVRLCVSLSNSRYMYWLNRVHKRIERAWMDGRHHDAYPFRDDTKDVVTTAALTLEQVLAFSRLTDYCLCQYTGNVRNGIHFTCFKIRHFLRLSLKFFCVEFLFSKCEYYVDHAGKIFHRFSV